jgi:hypothetical protein
MVCFSSPNFINSHVLNSHDFFDELYIITHSYVIDVGPKIFLIAVNLSHHHCTCTTPEPETAGASAEISMVIR